MQQMPNEITKNPESAPRVTIEGDAAARVSFGHERQGIPIVYEVRVVNHGTAPLPPGVIEISFEPSFGATTRVAVPAVAPGTMQSITRPNVSLDGARLRRVIEREPANLKIQYFIDGRPIANETKSVEILAFNEFDRSLLSESIAGFVLPNDPAVATLLEQARSFLTSSDGGRAFDGYQSKSRARARAAADAVYRAVQKLDISYITTPASFESTGQKLRLPAQLLEHRMGNCLDITIFAAAALEQCGLHPMICIQKTHAFPGVWLVDETFPRAVVDDPASIRNLCDAGDMLVFDSSIVTNRPPRPLADAEAVAREALNSTNEFLHAVDVRAARRARILPLPLSQNSENEDITKNARDGDAAPADEAVRREYDTHDRENKQKQRGRFDVWKERLLDLSARNRLIHFRPSREKSIELDCHDLAEFENALMSREKLILVPKISVEGADPRERSLQDARGAKALASEEKKRLLVSGKIATNHESDELAKRMTLIQRAAKSEIEETGSSTLYIAIGFLKWTDDAGGEKPRLAPILLYPVEAEGRGRNESYQIRPRGDDVRVNETLLQKLNIDFNIKPPEEAALVADESGFDVARVLDAFRRAVAKIPGFEVLDQIHLAFFSFNKYLLWRDLDESTEALRRNPLVSRLAEGTQSVTSSNAIFPAASTLDEIAPPTVAKLVLDADSSQHAAVVASLQNHSFVLQGPPGTGKSQTIANMIAELLASGKRVLFVAEKRAALDVVAKRLTNAGLGDACLELHSNKANKREVVAELVRVLDLAAPAENSNITNSERAETLGRSLQQYAKRMHEPTPLGMTLYEAACKFFSVRNAPKVNIKFDRVLDATAPLYQSRTEALAKFAAAAAAAGNITNHPLAACGIVEWTPMRAAEWETCLSEWIAASKDLLQITDSVKSILSNSNDPPVASLPRARDLGEHWVRYQSILGELLQTARPGLLDENPRALLGVYQQYEHSFFIVRWLGLRSAKATISKHLKIAPPAPRSAIELLTKASIVRELRDVLQNDLAALQAISAPAAAEFVRAADRYKNAEGAAVERLAIDRNRAFPNKAKQYTVHDALSLAEKLQPALGAARSWAPFIVSENGARAVGLSILTEAVRAGLLAIDELPAAHDRAFFEQWIYHKIEGAPELRSFDGRAFDRLMAEFQQFDKLTISQNGAAVARILASRRPSRVTNNTSKDAEIAILRRESVKKTQHIPIRKLLERIPNVVSSLKPCFLMSPLSIAQYLPPSRDPFDVVIFDEASQIPTHDAIGAIGRGTRVVVVGDTKQLPPTSFFTHDLNNTEDLQSETSEELETEVESILEECVASNVPQLYLTWHYRSRDERLIAFSNHHYYEKRLQTFPTPAIESKHLGIFLNKVKGVFGRGAARTNPVEARAVVDYVVNALRDPEQCKHSIGIVTFNNVQQTLVMDLLDLERERDPKLDIYFSDRVAEPVFVKNLENVQGDERDVMLFSIAYGPDEKGYISMNFGPLNKSGGERRLNVAITRAREKLVIFSSIGAQDIDLSRTRAKAADHLKQFLRYAEHGPAALGISVGSSSGGAFRSMAADLAQKLQKEGYKTEINVGCSNYRLDLAVRDRRDPRVYLLGIEFDGENYKTANTTRERERLRPGVLASLGWRTLRIWTPDYLYDPEREWARVKGALARAEETTITPAPGANAQIPTLTNDSPAAERKAPPR